MALLCAPAVADEHTMPCYDWAVRYLMYREVSKSNSDALTGFIWNDVGRAEYVHKRYLEHTHDWNGYVRSWFATCVQTGILDLP